MPSVSRKRWRKSAAFVVVPGGLEVSKRTYSWRRRVASSAVCAEPCTAPSAIRDTKDTKDTEDTNDENIRTKKFLCIFAFFVSLVSLVSLRFPLTRTRRRQCPCS